MANQELHKTHGKGVTHDTELMETCVRDFFTDNLCQAPPVALGAFPLVLGRSPGAGWVGPTSQCGVLRLMRWLIPHNPGCVDREILDLMFFHQRFPDPVPSSAIAAAPSPLPSPSTTSVHAVNATGWR